eukprot:333930-Chlamydomonas_euryale.AAC.2
MLRPRGMTPVGEATQTSKSSRRDRALANGLRRSGCCRPWITRLLADRADSSRAHALAARGTSGHDGRLRGHDSGGLPAERGSGWVRNLPPSFPRQDPTGSFATAVTASGCGCAGKSKVELGSRAARGGRRDGIAVQPHGCSR